MKTNDLRAQVATAVRACHDKKATDISILQLDAHASGFTDYFVICSGSNPRQVQAIADEVDDKLSASGTEPTHREGYNQAEWVLLDYVDFVVHIFSESARKFYDLETAVEDGQRGWSRRTWRNRHASQLRRKTVCAWCRTRRPLSVEAGLAKSAARKPLRSERRRASARVAKR